MAKLNTLRVQFAPFSASLNKLIIKEQMNEPDAAVDSLLLYATQETVYVRLT
jgi:hypothetical protein